MNRFSFIPKLPLFWKIALLLFVLFISLNIPFSRSPPVSTSASSTAETMQFVKEPTASPLSNPPLPNVIKDNLPSVVTISVESTSSSTTSLNSLIPFLPPNLLPKSFTQGPHNIGSGFIISSDGLIVTNRHVVMDKNAAYKVITNEGQTFPVVSLYHDPFIDLAIVKINAVGLRPVSLGDSSSLQLGEQVIAIGTPLGEYRNTVTVGVVSGLKRGVTAGSPYQGYVEKLDNVIQTDAAISPGNSGGPLLDADGQVIGVNTAVSELGQNIAFAIPVNNVKELIDGFNQKGFAQGKTYFGVRYQPFADSGNNTIPYPLGAHILDVAVGSPADLAGLRPGDIVTQFAGVSINRFDYGQLARLIFQKQAGDQVEVVYWRQNQEHKSQASLVRSVN